MMFTLHSGAHAVCRLISVECMTHMATMQHVYCISPMRSLHKVTHTCLLQVLDARDPLRYRSEDLESYSVQLHPTKGSVLLLNKADLLPAALRSAWADYFDQAAVEYVFWSAKAGIDSLTAQGKFMTLQPACELLV